MGNSWRAPRWKSKVAEIDEWVKSGAGAEKESSEDEGAQELG
jgi:hypothetical protein